MLLSMIPISGVCLWIKARIENRPINWVAFDPTVLDQHLRDGDVVLVNFTAAWNLGTASANRGLWERPQVRRLVRAKDVVAMKADWTHRDPQIKQTLNALGVQTIPLISVYSPTSPKTPIILHDLVSEREFLDALAWATE